jgi:hypothetical protein
MGILYRFVEAVAKDLEGSGELTRGTMQMYESIAMHFIDKPLYYILHEAIYCDGPGVAPGWAAYQVGKEIKEFRWLKEDPLRQVEQHGNTPLYFSSEMVYPFHADSRRELKGLKKLADQLANWTGWEKKYDRKQLKENQVLVKSIIYKQDLFVSPELSREAGLLLNPKYYEPIYIGDEADEEDLWHDAIRKHPSTVLDRLGIPPARTLK